MKYCVDADDKEEGGGSEEGAKWEEGRQGRNGSRNANKMMYSLAFFEKNVKKKSENINKMMYGIDACVCPSSALLFGDVAVDTKK